MPRLAVILFLAAPVLAEDFETRYHEAYKLEVVDGKVADAAARYLDLLREKDLPPHLKAQSEFRFAVACALLGRPDEARARLAALAEAPGTPAALKPQIEEYRKSLADLAPGSAASQRIEELVFQLGREALDYSRVPPVYRDFEILGAASVPHLRRLLDHSDTQLQEHAFRILCRMNEPGLAARWNPKWESLREDLGRYLVGRPEETAILEERLATMPPKEDEPVLYFGRHAAWSATFLKAYAARVEDPDNVITAAVARQDDPKNRELLATWLAEGPDAFAWSVAMQIASELGDYDESDVPKFDVRLFPAVSMRLARYPETNDDAKSGIEVAADGRPTDVLLDVLAAVLAAKDAPKRHAVAEPIARALARRATDEAQTRRFAALLDAWMSGARPPTEVVRACADRLPTDRAAQLVGRWFTGGQAAGYYDLVALKRPEDVALLRAAMEAMAPEQRDDFLNPVLSAACDRRETSPETYLAMARLLPTLVGKVEPMRLAGWMRQLGPRLAPEEAIALVVDLVRREPSYGVCDTLFRQNWNTTDDGAYRRDIAVPALPRVWDLLPSSVRTHVILSALRMLNQDGPLALEGERRNELSAFLRPRLGEMSYTEAMAGFRIIARYPDFFPLEAWLPASPQELWDTAGPFGGAIEQERLDRAARALVADPSKVTDTVLTFLEHCVSEDVKVECAAQLYRKADEALLRMLVSHRGFRPDPAVLEEAFERLADADLAVISRLGSLLAEVRPSEKLFKLAERLLASPDRAFVLDGIELSRSLGRDTLVPALLAKLDSMDAEVRTKAREAIDSILDLKRIKEEVAARLAGLR